jgi:RNA polymerase sigma-70 factor, ECF subfamily
MAWDNQEFTAVFNDIYSNLCRFLESILRGNGSAQDVAQETFVRLYRKGNPRMPPDEARFWVYRVARNLALNELTKMRTRGQLAENARSALHSIRPDPAEDYERSERGAILIELLKSLPEHQRAALVLREQQEMSYAEIARVLAISEGKVKIDIHRARIALRAKWREVYDDTREKATEM